MVLKLVVGIMEIEGGFLIGRRRGGNIGWSIDQMRREGFFSVQFAILSPRGIV